MRVIFQNFWGWRIIGPRLRHLKLLFQLQQLQLNKYHSTSARTIFTVLGVKRMLHPCIHSYISMANGLMESESSLFTIPAMAQQSLKFHLPAMHNVMQQSPLPMQLQRRGQRPLLDTVLKFCVKLSSQ
ncbi:hypothetical protein FGO68_gene4954 [Halteria grandinella]|uniref:Uncharacterized protein n=1 Tax=Halteria grandinella TaxID=5974 RepID=A0A8J8N9A5_HALGN|nr:hypothetical protein FGO68_gene4954 [Halteria grandinella]